MIFCERGNVATASPARVDEACKGDDKLGDDSGHADRTYRNCSIAETLIFCALGKFDLSQRDVLAVTNVARRGPSSSVNAPRRVLRSPLRILPGAVPASPSMSVSEVRLLPSMAQASGVPP